MSYTDFTESEALLAVVRDDLDEARRIIATMLPGERRQLVTQAHKLADLLQELADLLQEHDRIMEAVDGLCRWGYHCGMVSRGYILIRGAPRGICQRHTQDAEEDGYVVHEPPAEVTL